MFLDVTTTTTTADNFITNNSNYSNFEMIFWYSSLVFVLLVFILYMKFSKRYKKNVKKVQAKLGKEITRLEGVRKNTEQKNAAYDNLRKTDSVLAKVSFELLSMKSKTVLQEIDKALELTETIKKASKKINVNDYDEYMKQLNVIINGMSTLNSMYINIMGVIK